MLITQSFLDKWPNDIDTGNKWLQNQHPITVAQDVIASKLTSHDQDIDDVYLYSHSDRKRFHTRISDECNGLILDKRCTLVSKPFNRIHELGAYHVADLDWTRTLIECDYDGKIVVFFNHGGKWFVQTKQSVHAGDVMTIPSTGRSVSCRTLVNEFIRDNMRSESINDLLKTVMKSACIVCLYKHPEIHMCGPNGKEDLLLLGIIDKSPNKMSPARQLFSVYVDDIADMLGLPRPMQLEAKNKETVLAYINQLEPWQRGIIVQDADNKRIRISNPKFKPISKILRAGNEFTRKQIVGMFLTGFAEEVTKLEPRYNEPLRIFNKMVDVRVSLCEEMWSKAKDSSCQKEFASRVDHSLLNYVLFHARKFGPLSRTKFIQKITPDLAGRFIKNIGELDAFERSIEKARG